MSWLEEVVDVFCDFCCFVGLISGFWELGETFSRVGGASRFLEAPRRSSRVGERCWHGERKR